MHLGARDAAGGRASPITQLIGPSRRSLARRRYAAEVAGLRTSLMAASPDTATPCCGVRRDRVRGPGRETPAAGSCRVRRHGNPRRWVWRCPRTSRVLPSRRAGARAEVRSPARSRRFYRADHTASAAFDGAGHPHVVAAVGHLGDLHQDLARVGKRLVDIPQRAGPAAGGEVKTGGGLTF